MKPILIIAPFVVALIAGIGTIVIGGMFIPRTHRATRSLHVGAPVQRVWEVLTDFPAQPTWRRGLKSIERGPDMNGHPVWTETDTHGQKLPLEIVEATPPARLVSRIADPKLPFGGTWTYELAPEGAGTRLRITEDGEIRPPPFRYISRIIGTSATIEKYLGALAVKLGEKPDMRP